jgi:hypothetical protein
MRTDDLIHVLARHAGPAPRALPQRRLGLALCVGTLSSLVASLLLIGPIPAAMYALPAPWIKLGYALALAAAAARWVLRLGQPGLPTGASARTSAAVIAAMALLGLLSLVSLPRAEALRQMMGHSWASCPLLVFGLSLPTLLGALWALQGLAPTRPRQAGLAAGLLAGAVGAFAYAFACDELATSFVALWYSLGIGLAGALGTWLGPRWLRW